MPENFDRRPRKKGGTSNIQVFVIEVRTYENFIDILGRTLTIVFLTEKLVNCKCVLSNRPITINKEA